MKIEIDLDYLVELKIENKDLKNKLLELKESFEKDNTPVKKRDYMEEQRDNLKSFVNNHIKVKPEKMVTHIAIDDILVDLDNKPIFIQGNEA